jgi:beta-glucosidase
MRDRAWRWLGLAAVVGLAAVACGNAGAPANQQVSESVAALAVDEARIEALLAQMTVEEKDVLVHGSNFTDIAGIARLGIKPLRMVDGSMGVRYPIGNSIALPSETLMAASFNPDVVAKAAAALGNEVAASKFNMLLGPGLNIIRTPIGGRSFEYMSEDPWLTGAMGAAYVKGLQSQNVVATLKHYAMNSVETARQSYTAQVSERAMREIYLPGFKAAVDAGALAIMAAYNRVNGTHCTEHPWLLDDVLKKEWGYKGLVMSDWWAIHSTVAAAQAGLDVDMPGDSKLFEAPLLAAISAGTVSMEVLNDKARRVLRAMAFSGGIDTLPAVTVDSAASAAAALKMAEEGIVLLKNAGPVLPLDATKMKTVAIIGPNAAKPACSGRWSGEIPCRYEITPLAGIKKRLGTGVTVREALGDPAVLPAEAFQNLKVDYFANTALSGTAVLSQSATKVDVDFAASPPGGAVPATNFSARWTGTLVLDTDTQLALRSDDGSRAYVDDVLAVDAWSDHDATGLTFGGSTIKAGTHTVKVEYYQGSGGAEVHLLSGSNGAAIAAAKGADVAIVVVGTDRGYDMEGADKPDLKTLPGNDALVSAVAAANPNTVVVLTNGSAVEMPWVAEVPVIVEAFYAGMEAGTAISEVLFGDVNPSGKLPMTFPKALMDSPPHASKNYPVQSDVLKYDDDILVGYRYFDTKKVEPLFPFGHGLSYTTFQYSNLRVSPVGGGAFSATVSIKNTGTRQGAEAVQLYVHPTQSSETRPDKELKAFKKVVVEPGASVDVTLPLDTSSFQFWSATAKAWVLEPAVFQLLVGSSSRDLRMTFDLDLRNPADGGVGTVLDAGSQPGSGGAGGSAGATGSTAGGGSGAGGGVGAVGGAGASAGSATGGGAGAGSGSGSAGTSSAGSSGGAAGGATAGASGADPAPSATVSEHPSASSSGCAVATRGGTHRAMDLIALAAVALALCRRRRHTDGHGNARTGGHAADYGRGACRCRMRLGS